MNADRFCRFCDSTFGRLQDGDAYALDKNGDKIKKKRSIRHYRLREWEAEHGRDFGG